MYITRERNWEALLCVISPYKGQQKQKIYSGESQNSDQKEIP